MGGYTECICVRKRKREREHKDKREQKQTAGRKFQERKEINTQKYE